MLGSDSKQSKKELFQWIAIAVLAIFFVFTTFFQKKEYMKAEFHFGRNYYPAAKDSKSKEVSRDDWDKFIQEFVTPLYPLGLTTTESQGQMFDGKKLEKQDNFELFIVCKNESKERENLLKVAEEYKRRFQNSQILVYFYDVDPVFYNK